MPDFTAEAVAQHARRCAIVQVVRSHPDWTLAQVLELLTRTGAGSETLATITIGELLEPQIDPIRLRRAERLTGPRFDALVLEVITRAGRPVGAGHVRARLGGPRWKLQASFRRLEAKGTIKRSGITSGVRYFLVQTNERTA